MSVIESAECVCCCRVLCVHPRVFVRRDVLEKRVPAAVAAAYGDGSERFWRARTHICLLHFGEAERSEGGNMHNFLSTSRWYQCFDVLLLPITADQKSPYSIKSCSIMHTLSGPPVDVPGCIQVTASRSTSLAGHNPHFPYSCMGPH